MVAVRLEERAWDWEVGLEWREGIGPPFLS